MTKPNINIQDGYLFQNLKAATMMDVGLINGEAFHGRLRRFDRFAIVLEQAHLGTLGQSFTHVHVAEGSQLIDSLAVGRAVGLPVGFRGFRGFRGFTGCSG